MYPTTPNFIIFWTGNVKLQLTEENIFQNPDSLL